MEQDCWNRSALLSFLQTREGQPVLDFYCRRGWRYRPSVEEGEREQASESVASGDETETAKLTERTDDDNQPENEGPDLKGVASRVERRGYWRTGGLGCSSHRSHKTICQDFQYFIGDEPSFVRKLKLVSTLESHRGCVNTIIWNSTGDKLISGSDDTTVKIWDMNKLSLLASLDTLHTANIFNAHFLPFTGDNQVVSCAADTCVVFIQDVNLNANSDCLDLQKKYTCHTHMVNKLGIIPESSYIFLSCSLDGTVRQFDIREPHSCDGVACRRAIISKLSPAGINSMAVSKMDGNLYCTGGSDPYVRLFDRRRPKTCIRKFTSSAYSEGTAQRFFYGHHITSVVFNYNATEIAASYNANGVVVYDILKEESLQLPVPPSSDSDGNVSSPVAGSMEEDSHDANDKDGAEEYETGESEEMEEDESNDKAVPIEDNSIHTYHGHLNIRTVKECNFFGPKSEYVMSGSDDGSIFIWKKSTEDLVMRFPGDRTVVNCLQGHPLGYPILATSGIENDVKVWAPLGDIAPFPSKPREESRGERLRHVLRLFISSGYSDDDTEEDGEDTEEESSGPVCRTS